MIGTQPTDLYGGSMQTEIIFNAYSDILNNVLLDISGIVAIVYFESFSEAMPSLLTTVSHLQAVRIFSIYDAMGVERPTLTMA